MGADSHIRSHTRIDVPPSVLLRAPPILPLQKASMAAGRGSPAEPQIPGPAMHWNAHVPACGQMLLWPGPRSAGRDASLGTDGSRHAAFRTHPPAPAHRLLGTLGELDRRPEDLYDALRTDRSNTPHPLLSRNALIHIGYRHEPQGTAGTVAPENRRKPLNSRRCRRTGPKDGVENAAPMAKWVPMCANTCHVCLRSAADVSTSAQKIHRNHRDTQSDRSSANIAASPALNHDADSEPRSERGDYLMPGPGKHASV